MNMGTDISTDIHTDISTKHFDMQISKQTSIPGVYTAGVCPHPHPLLNWLRHNDRTPKYGPPFERAVS